MSSSNCCFLTTCKSRKSRYTWSNRQIWPWGTKRSKALLSKSLKSRFLLMGGAVFPPCSLAWGQTAAGNCDLLLKKGSPPRTAAVSAPDPAAGHCQPLPPPETPRHTQEGLVSCGITAPFSWVLVHTRFCSCPPWSVSPVLWKCWNQIPLTLKVRFPGDTQFLCQIPRLGSLFWGLELLQVWEFLWYNCSPVCESPAWWLYSGANDDFLQEDLCLARALKASALGQPEGWGRERGGRGVQDGETYVHLWVIHVNVRQKPPQ